VNLEEHLAEDPNLHNDLRSDLPRRQRAVVSKDSQQRPLHLYSYELATQQFHFKLSVDRTHWALLTEMGQWIRSTIKYMRLIAVGGAVNVFTSESRDMTRDFNFLGTNLSASKRALLVKAARHAQSKNIEPVGEVWLNDNNNILLSNRPDLHRKITTQAPTDKEYVFGKVNSFDGKQACTL